MILDSLNSFSDLVFIWQPGAYVALAATVLLAVSGGINYQHLTVRTRVIVGSITGLSLVLSLVLISDEGKWAAYLKVFAIIVTIGLTVTAFMWSRRAGLTYEKTAAATMYVAQDLAFSAGYLLLSVTMLLTGELIDDISYDHPLAVACNVVAGLVCFYGLLSLSGLLSSRRRHHEWMRRIDEHAKKHGKVDGQPVEQIGRTDEV